MSSKGAPGSNKRLLYSSNFVGTTANPKRYTGVGGSVIAQWNFIVIYGQQTHFAGVLENIACKMSSWLHITCLKPVYPKMF